MRYPPLLTFKIRFSSSPFFNKGHLRSTARIPSMRTLHHTPYTIFVLILIILARPTMRRYSMPSALLQRPLSQALRKDAPAALPRAEPGERAPPRIREETRVDGAPRARACAARLLLAPQQQQGRQQASAGGGTGSSSNGTGSGEEMREDWSVYRTLADLGMEEKLVRLWHASPPPPLSITYSYLLTLLQGCTGWSQTALHGKPHTRLSCRRSWCRQIRPGRMKLARLLKRPPPKEVATELKLSVAPSPHSHAPADSEVCFFTHS